MSREKKQNPVNDPEALRLAERLRELREVMAAKRPEFAAVSRYTSWLKVPNSTYSNWEKGLATVPAIAIRKIALRTDASTQWLVNNVGPMFLQDAPERTGTEDATETPQNAAIPGICPDRKVISPCAATGGHSSAHESGVSEDETPYLEKVVRTSRVADDQARYLEESPQEAARARLKEVLEYFDRYNLVAKDELRRLLRESGERAPRPILRVVAGRDLPDEAREAVEREKDLIRVVPILEGSVAAGAPREVWDADIDGYAFCYASALPHPEATSCVRVRGDSMAPSIPDGALVGVDHAVRDAREMRAPKGRPRRAAIRADGGIVIRNVELYGHTLVCRPENPGPDHPEFSFDLSDEGAENPIAGQVIWRWVGEI